MVKSLSGNAHIGKQMLQGDEELSTHGQIICLKYFPSFLHSSWQQFACTAGPTL